MRKLMLGAVMALVLPATALAVQGTASPQELAKTACKTEKSQMGTKTFKKTYAAKSTSKAMKACLAKQGVVAETVLENAAQECKAEREADPVKFAEYGTNENGKNAYGKCVSSKAQAESEENTEDRVSAAETCKAMTKEAREAEFGTKKNAFGKCVSKTAEESGDEEE
jgi:hypothetical protein